MARSLHGFNKRFTVTRRTRTFTASGSVSEGARTVIAAGVPGTVQPHVLNNIPPNSERTKSGGLVRVDEYRLWLGDPSVVRIELDDIIEEEGTNPLRLYRVLAALDDGGRGHHQLMRVESYSEQSAPWAAVGEGS